MNDESNERASSEDCKKYALVHLAQAEYYLNSAQKLESTRELDYCAKNIRDAKSWILEDGHTSYE